MVHIDDMSKESLEKYYKRKFGGEIKKKEYFEIPSNIKVDESHIWFNGGKQALLGILNTYGVQVDISCTTPTDCVLVPCNLVDLKLGDVALRTLGGTTNFEELEDYCVILNNRKCVSVDCGEDIVVHEKDNKMDWYKVVPRNEVE